MFWLEKKSEYAVFYVKGRKWRDKFELELKSRYLQSWKLILLSIVGMLLIFYSSVISALLSENSVDVVVIETMKAY